MTAAEFLEYVGDDATRWAAEFCKAARDRGHCIEEDWMEVWFANAIEHSHGVRLGRIEGKV